jgi:hypothetical protein
VQEISTCWLLSCIKHSQVPPSLLLNNHCSCKAACPDLSMRSNRGTFAASMAFSRA